MPQLSADVAQKAAEAESLDFELVPEGVYEVLLKEDVSVQDGPKGPYWQWIFAIPSDAAEYANRQFWVNTSLGENALWKLNEVFTAFGVPTSTNTEDLVGRRVQLTVVQKIAEKGKKAGELVNEVRQVLPLSEISPSAAKPAGTKAGTPEDVPLF